MTGIVVAQKVQILGASGTAVSGAADLNENTLATIVVPAGSMGPNGTLRITTLWTITNSVNNKTLRVKFGGTTFFGIIYTANASVFQTRLISNRNSASVQGSYSATSEFPTTTGAITTGAVDTTTSQNILITGQKALAGETITIESYLVELITP